MGPLGARHTVSQLATSTTVAASRGVLGERPICRDDKRIESSRVRRIEGILRVCFSPS